MLETPIYDALVIERAGQEAREYVRAGLNRYEQAREDANRIASGTRLSAHVVCPTCHATTGHECRTSSGRKSRWHAGRRSA